MTQIVYRHSAGDAIPVASIDGNRLLLEDLAVESLDPGFWSAVAKAAEDNHALCARAWRRGVSP